jgi:hypothetical protein
LTHLNGHGQGSITGSIAEEDENGGSSGSEDGGNYVVHENKAGPIKKSSSTTPGDRSQTTITGPRGVPSVNAPSRPISMARRGSGSSDEDARGPSRVSGLFGSRAGGRRAASEIGMGYRPPTGRQPLRRTYSNDAISKKKSNGRQDSDAGSSVGSYRKRKGFFSALKGFFKGKGRSGSSIRSGRDSPPYGTQTGGRSSGGGWQTRTDANVKRATSTRSKPSAARSRDDSSSDEDQGNLVAVQNVGKGNWAIDSAKSSKLSTSKRSSTPIASGLIPEPRPTRSDLGAGSRATSTSTITPRTAGASTSKQVVASAPVSRSNTLKSTASKRNRKNGSIARATSTGDTTGRTIMSLVDADKAKEGPKMIEVPTAPRSQVIPNLTLAKAPGSSLVLPSQMPPSSGYAASVTPSQSVSQAGRNKQNDSSDDEKYLRPVTPSLPPSRSLSPPLKSAMRPISPAPSPAKDWTKSEPPVMTSVTAPGRITSDAPPAPEPEPAAAPVLAADDASIYESAREEEDDDDEVGSSDEESFSGLKVIENDRTKTPAVSAQPQPAAETEEEHATPKAKSTALPELAPPIAAPSGDGSEMTAGPDGAKVRRRKSVRMNVPDTPDATTPDALQAQQAAPREKPSSWSTRIGHSKDDSSDEDGAAYVKAKRSLSRNSGKWEMVNGEKVRKKGKA